MLTPEIKSYINKLVSAYSDISAIWLFGSRANNEAREDFDWDFLVFANKEIFESLKKNTPFHKNNIDLLVPYDSNDFKKPWGDEEKKFNLKSAKWKQISDTQAQYTTTKWVKDEESTKKYGVEMYHSFEIEENAKRIWP